MSLENFIFEENNEVESAIFLKILENEFIINYSSTKTQFFSKISSTNI